MTKRRQRSDDGDASLPNRGSLRSADAAHVELLVIDTGVGIPETEQPRVFDRFHRVEVRRARTHEGLGIGLALVQDLVRLHGGEISVSNRVNAGTAFTVRVPTGHAHLPPGQIAHAPRCDATATVRRTTDRPDQWAGQAVPSIRDRPSLQRPRALLLPTFPSGRTNSGARRVHTANWGRLRRSLGSATPSLRGPGQPIPISLAPQARVTIVRNHARWRRPQASSETAAVSGSQSLGVR